MSAAKGAPPRIIMRVMAAVSPARACCAAIRSGFTHRPRRRGRFEVGPVQAVRVGATWRRHSQVASRGNLGAHGGDESAPPAVIHFEQLGELAVAAYLASP